MNESHSAAPGSTPNGTGGPSGAPAGDSAATLTPDAAREEINRLSADREFTSALLGQKGVGPAYRDATARWKELNMAAAAKPATVASPADAAATGLPSRGYADAKSAEIMLEAMQPPATPDDYKVNRQGVPNWDNDLEGEARQLSHAMGLSQGDFDGVLSIWNRAVEKPPTVAEVNAQADATERQLIQRYGEAGAKAKLDAANSVIKALPEAQRARVKHLLAESGIGNSPWLIERLAMQAERRGPAAGSK